MEPSETTGDAWDTVATALTALVLAPLDAHLTPETNRALLRPDGMLPGIPFAALPGESGEGFRIDDRDFVLLAFATKLLGRSDEAAEGGAFVLEAVDSGRP